MRRKRLLQVLFALGAFLATLVAVLRSEWMGKKTCAGLQTELSRVTGLDIRIGHCQLEPEHLGAELRDVTLSLRPGQAPLAKTAKAEVRLGFGIFSGLFGPIRLSKVELDKPQIDLDLSHLTTEGAPPPKGTCQVNELVQKVNLGKLAITDGHVHVLLPGDRALELNALDVTARSSSRGVTTARVSQEHGKFTFPGGELPLDKLLISAQVDAPSTSLEVSRLELLGGQVSVLGHGTAHNLCDPDLQVEANAGAPLDLVSALLDNPHFTAKGYVTANVRLSGKLAQPRAHAEVDVNDLAMVIDGNHLDPKDLTASVDFHDNLLELRQLYWPLGDGYGKISGSLELHDNYPLVINAEGKNVPFGELLNRLPLKHPWVDSSANVKGHLVGHILPTPTFGGPVVADFNDFHVRTHAWDAPREPGDEVFGFKHEHVECDLNFNPDRVRLTKVRLTGPTAELVAPEVILNTDPLKGLDLTADLKSLDLAEVGGAIAGLPWAGHASAHAHITGAYGKQNIDAQLQIKDFTMSIVHLGDTSGSLHFDPSMVLQFKDVVAVKNGRTTYKGNGLLDFSHGAPLGGGLVNVNNGRIEDLLQVLHDVHWAFAMLDGQMTGLVSGTINLKKGPIMAPTSDFDLHFKEMNLYQRPIGQADFKMHTQDGDSITIPPFTIDGAMGTLTFGGWQRVGADLHYNLSMEELSVPVATAPELTSWDMTGTLSGHMSITGPSQQVAINGEVFGSDLTMFGLPVGQGHVQLRGTGASMAITGPVGDDVNMNMRMRWENELPMAAHFAFDVGDLFKYVPTSTQWNDVSGQVHGTLDVTGNMKDSTSYVGHFLFPKVQLTKGDYTEENSEPILLDFHDDVWELRSFSFRGHKEGERVADTEFSVTGTRRGEENKLDLGVKGTLDAKLLETLYPYIENASGRIDVAAAVTGTQSRPALVGSLQIARGHLKLRDQNIVADDLRGRIEFSQASVEIPDLQGTVNRGPAHLSGSVALKKFSPSQYDLRLTMDESQFHFTDWPTFTATGELDYVGPPDNPVVSGSLTVDRFRYAEDLTLERVLENLKNKKLEARVYTRSPHLWTYKNMGIDLGNDVKIDTNYLKTGLRGHLNVSGDNGRPVLLGQIEGTEGGQAFYQGNTFQVDELLVNFKDSERITPELDAHATTLVRDYKVFLHLWGTPDDPHVEPSSQPELSRADLITLLTLGFTSQDRGAANNLTTAGANAAFDALIGLSGIDQQAQKFVPKGGSVLKDPSFRLTTTYSQRLGSMQPTAQLEGKVLGNLLHDKLKVRVQQQPNVSGGRGTKAQLEYKIDDHWSAQGQYDGDNSDYSFPDLGLDLKFHQEMK